MLNATLAKSYPPKFAAQLTRVYWDAWTHAVAYAESDPEKPAHFRVIDVTAPDGRAGCSP